MKNIYYPSTWEYVATISFHDIAGYLTDGDYEKYKDKYLSVDVTLSYDVQSEDKDVNAGEAFSFVEWNTSVEYPDVIQYAIDKYLAIEENRYSEQAYDKLCDYMDYQKYGDY